MTAVVVSVLSQGQEHDIIVATIAAVATILAVGVPAWAQQRRLSRENRERGLVNALQFRAFVASLLPLVRVLGEAIRLQETALKAGADPKDIVLFDKEGRLRQSIDAFLLRTDNFLVDDEPEAPKEVRR